MKKIIKFHTDNEALINQAFHIRSLVFVDEQNVDIDLEFDGFDDEAVHYIFFSEDVPAGTSRMRITGEGFKLERLAVLKEHRGKGVGGMLMEYMMNDIQPTDKKIYLNAQADIEKIYEKYGFRREGNMFYDANIKHYKMVYKP